METLRRSYLAASRSVFLVFTVLVLMSCAAGQHRDSQHPMGHHNSPAGSAPSEIQEWAKAKLAKSSRHREWVKVKNGNREVSSFVVYPEVKNKATAVIVIHEINGMTDWVQSLTDQLAEAGYIAIAPDLLSGMGPNGGGTTDVATVGSNAVGVAIRELPPDQITGDLKAVADYVGKLPSANGKVVVAGFCWGGGQSFRYATNNAGLRAAFVFYGPPPMNKDQTIDKAALSRIAAPVYGFYAENDSRINATLPATVEAMKELKKKFDPATYEGAGHGFMRAGEAPEPQAPPSKDNEEADKVAAETYQKALAAYKANKKARDEAWKRWKKILAAI
ncbi:MAG: dienelactone hydrolase family protein [Acidobacteriota bacterium]|nr:dienelactone hydrolase family protein [Acidobacteriota bacterium]